MTKSSVSRLARAVSELAHAIGALAALILAAAPVAFAGGAMTIDRCGESVPPGVIAYLAADLDCRDAGIEGVVLGDRARLVMNGFAIIGDPADRGQDERVLQGVRCEAGTVCTIEGPGAVTGFSASGVAGTRVRLRNVWISDNAKAGVSAFENVRLRGVVIDRNGTLAVHAGGRVHAVDAEVGNADNDVVEWRAPSVRPGDAQPSSPPS